MPSSFRGNAAGIAALARTPAMRAAMLDRAERVANAARAIAPVDTGAYLASIEASTVERDGKICGRVTADPESPEGYHYAAILEFGGEHMDAQRVLGRALDTLR